MLGTNDMSGLGGSEVNWPTYAEDVADDATALLAIVRAGSPSARVHISLVYDFSDDVADWADADTLDAYYRRHRLVSDALYRRFAARENESLYVLATHVLLDPAGDFDANNVHPNAAGHARIGRAVAASILRRAAA
jgi:lysophospholipase L1-like esterase